MENYELPIKNQKSAADLLTNIMVKKKPYVLNVRIMCILNCLVHKYPKRFKLDFLK